jgi:hypothetical protein
VVRFIPCSGAIVEEWGQLSPWSRSYHGVPAAAAKEEIGAVLVEADPISLLTLTKLQQLALSPFPAAGGVAPCTKTG